MSKACTVTQKFKLSWNIKLFGSKIPVNECYTSHYRGPWGSNLWLQFFLNGRPEMLLTNLMLLYWFVTSYSSYCCGSEGTWLGNCILVSFLLVVCCQFGSVYVTGRGGRGSGAVTEWLSDVLKTSKQNILNISALKKKKEKKCILHEWQICFCCKSRQFRPE